MLLTDWLKRLSASRLGVCSPSRISRRHGARVIGAAEVSSQPETLEKRTLLSATTPFLLTDVSGATGFQLSGASPGGSNLGNAIKPAGDVNGDGFEDVIIGAYYENFTAGTAYVIFGKSTGFSPPPDLDNLSATDGFAIRGATGAIPGPADYAGTAVSGAGDVNGDGFDDVLVATSKYSLLANGSSGYVIFGKANNTEVNLSDIDSAASDTVGFRLTGFGSTPDFNGADAAATGGDINGDGYDDIAFGGPRTNVGGSYGVGAAYVVFGKENGFTNLNVTDLTGSNGFRFTDSQAVGDASNQAYIGSAVSISGDINGDGFDDLVVGAPKLNTGQYGVTPGYDGQVYVVFGGPSFGATVEINSLNGVTGFSATGVSDEQAATGASISSGGDVNGDGIDDFVVGAPGSYDYDHVTGRAYVVFGKTNLGSTGSLDLTQVTGTSGFILNGAANYDVAGTSVSITGDINGDGFDDVVVGAPTISSNSVDPGATNGQAYVVFGGPNVSATVPGNLDGLNGVTGFKLSGSGSYHAGQRVTSGSDLNGDGFDEVFIGEPYSSRGTVTVFFGTDFGLNNGIGTDGELGNGLQKINGSAAGTLTADAGPSAADILVGGGGDDTLTADGGADVLIGGSGDDILEAKLSNFSASLRFDGGTGVDTLATDASFNGQTIDLTTIAGNRINDVEVIDLEDGATETLTLDLATVLAITGAGPTTASSSLFAINDAHTLTILRDTDDVINGIANGVNGWISHPTTPVETIDGKTFDVFTRANGAATVRIQQAVVVTGNIDGDGDFDSNDSFLINIAFLGAIDSLLEDFKGGSPLTVTEIRTAITALTNSGKLDVDGNGQTNGNDTFLVNIIELGALPSLVDDFKGASPMTAAQIIQNVNALNPASGRAANPVAGPATVSVNVPVTSSQRASTRSIQPESSDVSASLPSSFSSTTSDSEDANAPNSRSNADESRDAAVSPVKDDPFLTTEITTTMDAIS
jgi:hypothetical protein